MADDARHEPAAVKMPDRRQACLAQARIFREQAETDPLNRAYWFDQATKWLERASTPAGPVVVTIDSARRPEPTLFH